MGPSTQHKGLQLGSLNGGNHKPYNEELDCFRRMTKEGQGPERQLRLPTPLPHHPLPFHHQPTHLPLSISEGGCEKASEISYDR